MPKTTEAAKEARRTQILDAAVRCFARRGYYETTIEDLVVETGLSRGALYVYFPSKETIYLAISDRWQCGLNAALRTRLTPELTPAQILRLLIIVRGEHIQAESEACRVLLEGRMLAHYIPELSERSREQQQRSLQGLTQLLQAGIASGDFRADLEVETQARILRATFQGLMVQWHQQPGCIDWSAVAEEIVRGLRP